MGVSTYVRAFMPPDDEWRTMKAVWDACQDACVTPPPEVREFFSEEEPTTLGKEVSVIKAVTESQVDTTDIIHVDIKKLPAGTRFIQFCNSY